MAKDEGQSISIKSSAIVTLTDMGHIVEIQHMEKKNTSCHVRKLDADTYVVLETGEIREFEKSTNRSENENSLRKTFKKLRYLVNNNFKGNPNELFVTFTFAKESFDNKMVYKDFQNFMDRLRYKYKKTTTIDYLNVIEPHASGQWHSHMLIRFNDLDKVYIKNSDLRELWGHGWVTIKSLKDVDNIGAYVSAYLADVEVPEGRECHSDNLIVKEVDGQEKRFIKGGRLWMYPPGMNLYRKSKGIVYPPRIEMTYEDTKKVVGSVKPHYQKQYMVEHDDFKNTITYEQYNTKR